MDVILDQSSEHLLCCRVCLMTDCKLFNIHEYKLADAFSRISGTPVFKGRLPQYLCTYCHTLLLKCAKFRLMCLRTERCLKQEILNGELNTDRILKVDRMAHRLFHLTLTEVEHVDLQAKSANSQPNDVVDIDEPKIERDMDEENINIDEDTDNAANTGDINEATEDTDDIEAYSVVVNKYKANITSIDEDTNDNDANSNIVNVNKDKENIIDLDETSGDTDNNGTQVTASIDTVAANLDKVGIVNMPKPLLNTVNTQSTVIKPNLKMELEVFKGELKIKVVKDAKNIPAIKEIETKKIANIDRGTDVIAKNIPAVKKIITKKKANSDRVTAISNVKCSLEQMLLKNIEKGKRLPKKGAKNYMNLRKENMNTVNKNKVQIRIFKNSKDMFKNLGILNTDALHNMKTLRREFDHSKFEKDYEVKVVTLTKEEQLEEIAARKQSANYLEAQYRCEDCGRAFGTEATYNNHRTRHSPSAGDAACEICSLRFNRHNRRRGHQLTHQLKIVCNTCGFVARSRYNARAHHAMHQGKIFCCPHCGKIFSKHSTYLSHVRIAHPAEHAACDLCGETFIGARGLRTHKQLVHKHSENQKPQAQHKCSTCSASFVSLDALNTHADLCEHDGCPCEQCGESCESEEALQAHVEARHPPEGHRCEECCMTFSSAAAYDVHYRRKHLNERASQPPGAPRRSRPSPRRQLVMCDQCGKVLKLQTAAQLRAHMNGHLGLKPYACPHCPKAFAANYLRKEHLRAHTGERPFQCEMCPLAFANKGNMQRHHKFVHLGEHDHATCHICGRVCTTRGSLRLHVAAVHHRQGWPKRKRTSRAAHSDADDNSSSTLAASPRRQKRTSRAAHSEAEDNSPSTLAAAVRRQKRRRI